MPASANRIRALAVVATMGLFAPCVWSQAPAAASSLKSSPQLMTAMTEVVAPATSYTVRVLCDKKDAALGTIVDADGWVITKYSELKSDAVCKLKDGREIPAKLVGVHVAHDLAMLKIEAKGLPVVQWRNSKDTMVGAWVASAGTGKEPVAVGVVSVLSRSLGGPRVLPGANAGYLGVRMEPVEMGVKIVEVSKDTPAEKCGLKVGDIIRSVNGAPVIDLQSMQEILAKTKSGDKAAIKIDRDAKPMELVAELGKRPQNLARGDFQNSMGSVLSERRLGFPTILQHDTVIKPTDCGGPLVDLDGKAIGINIARAGRTESYAIPSEVVQTVLTDLKTGKLPPPADLRKISAANDRIKAAEAAKAKAIEDKSAAEKKIKEADDAIKKAKEEIEAEKKKSEKK